MLTYSVLGPLRVERGGKPVALKSERQRALLAVLLAGSGQTVSVDRIVEAVWGDDPPAEPAAAVQTHVSRLRRIVGAEAVTTEATGYRLDVSSAKVDAVEFERMLGDARHAMAEDPDRAVALLDSALALWSGRAYEEFADRDFARPLATRLEEMRESCEEDHAQALLSVGRAADAVAALESQVARNPLRERSHALLMRALYADGRPTEALDTYARYRDRIGDELGLEPSAALRDLESAILRHDLPAPVERAAAPPPSPEPVATPLPQSGPGAPHDLPVALTSLVGRDKDVAHVSELLAARRLVTITGPGGVGKSRLAQEIARDLETSFRDGAWWCDLATAAAADAEDVVAAALGVQHRADVSLTERLVDFLRPRHLLLVLDSCEHVLDQIAPLAEAITTRTREITLLVTSLEPLAANGEQRWPLAPLAPPVQPDISHPAIVLFLERARAVRPQFEPTDDELDTIAELCRRLDGLPLAIELAAARMSALGPAEILAGLDERFSVLVRHRRPTGGRHRSLRATVEWSFDLLDDESRELLCELSVFAGVFGVRDVADVAGRPEAVAAELLVGLVDRSLVVEHHDGGRSRFSLLETLRDYGREQLDPEALARLADRHADHVLRVVTDAARGIGSPDEPEHAAALDGALDELRVAHRHLLEHADTDRLLTLWSPTPLYLYGRLRSEMHLMAEEAAKASLHTGDPRISMVAGAASIGAWQRGNLEWSQQLAELGLAEAGDDAAARVWCEAALGDVELLRGNLTEADRWYAVGAEHAEEAGDQISRAVALAGSALPLAYAGDVEGAGDRARLALDVAQETANPTALALAHYCAGELLLDVDAASAQHHLGLSVEQSARAGTDFFYGVALLSAVTLQGRTGDPAGALTRYPELVELWHRAGRWAQEWTTLRNLAELLVRTGHYRPAAVLLGATWAPSEGSAVFGAEAQRLEMAREQLVERLGEDEMLESIALGATFDAPRSVRFARETLAEIFSA